MEVTNFTFPATGAPATPIAPSNVAYRPMTWGKATEYYIKNFDVETNNFRKNAGAVSTFLRKLGTLKWPWFASVLGICDDVVNFTPAVVLAAPVTLTTTAVAVPTAIFMAYSARRISKIKRNADELGLTFPYTPKKR